MEKSSILHIPKSNYAYAKSKTELVVWLRCKKNDLKNVFIKYTDPFCWTDKGFDIKLSKMNKQYQTELFDYYKITINTETRRTRYIFVLEEKGNRFTYYGAKEFISIDDKHVVDEHLFNYFNFPYLNEEDILVSPEWSKNTIWYQIFIDRFHNEGNEVSLGWNSKEEVTNEERYGGNIKGIIAKLDYLKELGISGIYFTPLFEAGSIHKYDTIDYYKIDPDFGSNEDFKLLVEEAHKRGIKVMLDIVFNHCGIDHPFFKDVLEKKKDSEYYDYFMHFDEDKDLFIDDNPNYHTFAFVKNMPKWNTTNANVRNYLLDIARFWINNFNVDGYRLDVSNEVSHLFWKEFSNTCRNLKKDFVIIGENWDNSSAWLGADQFDSVMNYELYYPIINFFSKDKKSTSEAFASAINSLIVSYPENHISAMFNLLGCHDTRRIKTVCGDDERLAKLAFIFLFTFTGSPNIYYGDEIGLTGYEDPNNRKCMNFDLIGNEFYNFTKKLISIRTNNQESLGKVDINWHYSKGNVLVYSKDDIFVILNNNDKEVNCSLVLEGTFTDLFTDEFIQETSFKLPSYGYKLIKRN